MDEPSLLRHASRSSHDSSVEAFELLLKMRHGCKLSSKAKPTVEKKGDVKGPEVSKMRQGLAHRSQTELK